MTTPPPLPPPDEDDEEDMKNLLQNVTASASASTTTTVVPQRPRDYLSDMDRAVLGLPPIDASIVPSRPDPSIVPTELKVGVSYTPSELMLYETAVSLAGIQQHSTQSYWTSPKFYWSLSFLVKVKYVISHLPSDSSSSSLSSSVSGGYERASEIDRLHRRVQFLTENDDATNAQLDYLQESLQTILGTGASENVALPSSSSTSSTSMGVDHSQSIVDTLRSAYAWKYHLFYGHVRTNLSSLRRSGIFCTEIDTTHTPVRNLRELKNLLTNSLRTLSLTGKEEDIKAAASLRTVIIEQDTDHVEELDRVDDPSIFQHFSSQATATILRDGDLTQAYGIHGVNLHMAESGTTGIDLLMRNYEKELSQNPTTRNHSLFVSNLTNYSIMVANQAQSQSATMATESRALGIRTYLSPTAIANIELVLHEIRNNTKNSICKTLTVDEILYNSDLRPMFVLWVGTQMAILSHISGSSWGRERNPSHLDPIIWKCRLFFESLTLEKVGRTSEEGVSSGTRKRKPISSSSAARVRKKIK